MRRFVRILFGVWGVLGLRVFGFRVLGFWDFGGLRERQFTK